MALVVASGPAGAVISGAGCGPAWQVVSSPNVTLHDEGLVATAAASATDAWGVGWYAVGGNVFRALTMHWDGSAWTAVSAPAVGAVEDTLEAVTSGAQGTWAVGLTRDTWGNRDPIHPLILHWDGTAWQVSPAAELPVAQNMLGGVTGSAADDVWAVGEATNGSPSAKRRPLVEHWNGTAWSLVPTPDLTNSAGLSGVTEVTPTDVWAVGWRSQGQHTATLAEHWDGSTWTVVPTPSRPGQDTGMRAISAASSTEVWMAGSSAPFSKPAAYRPVGELWDGTSWSAVAAPSMGRLTYFLGVVAPASGQAVAVGEGRATPGGPYLTLVERWDGSSWSIEDSPSPGPAINYLYGVAEAGGTTWAVGAYEDGTGRLLTLIEESCSA
jgi:hypothetical protein